MFRNAKPIMANSTKSSTPESPPQLLRASNAHWDEGKVKELLKKAPEELEQDEAVLLIRELDRRFMQLWDKVTFEREHGLIDYGKLQK